MSLRLPRFYPITNARISGLSHAEQVKRLIAGGATLIQLREKEASPSEFFRDAETAMGLARDAGVSLIINDRVDIALALGADGVHLGQSDVPVASARRLLGESAIIGLSTHNANQLRAAAGLSMNYIAFGPIFDTLTKEDRDPTAGLEALGTARRLVPAVPIVAIGGIGFENALSVLAAGADSIAVISAVLSDPAKIEANTRRMVALTGN